MTTMTVNGEKERRSRTLDVVTNSATTVIILQQPTPNENVVNIPAAAAASTTTEVLVWRRPWIVALCLFSIFTLPWIYFSVFRRYWILEEWNAALPGLGDSVFRKLSIRSHMTFGCICLLCVPIQLILPNTVMCWRHRISRNIHRYTGRLYVICAILSFIFGQWFICLKQFRLVGGYNMGAAFSFAGLFIAYFAYMTWKTAPSKNTRNNNTSTSDNNHNQKYTIENHRNYAIRSFSQIIAPILYRYWYIVMVILRLHVPPPEYNERNNRTNDDDEDVPPSLICDDHNVCPDYERPVDAIFCWLYWISAWIVAEIVIICLPDHKSKSNNINATTATQENQDMEHATLITRIDSMNGEKSFVSVVNFLGCFLAGITIMVTGYILSAIFMPQNN